MQYLLVLVVIIAIWSLWSHFSSGVEHAHYSVKKKSRDYEIREYSARIEAQTTVNGSYETALGQGFRIIAGYIFGGNTRQESISMTAPVIAQKMDTTSSEKIAMTAPVTIRDQGDKHTVSFVMPSSYTLESLPTPKDGRVKIVSVKSQKIAALQFSWYRTPARVRDLQKKLLEVLARDGEVVAGQPAYAGYNAPWTPPWLMRNEVLVQVE